jgi:hypothetical protein
MIRLHRILPWTLAAAMLLAAGCSDNGNGNNNGADQAANGTPAPKTAISSCVAVSAADASSIVGETVTANRFASDNAPRSICAYINDKKETLALINLEKGDKYPDMGKALLDDQKTAKVLFNGNVKPPVFHQADGFMQGAFYADITPRYGVLEVQLYTFEGGYKLIVSVNNPPDFATGEKQAEAFAHKVFENIKNGTAFVQI